MPGLILPATLALRLGLPELVRQRLDLGDAAGQANTGDKMMTLVASALAGGDCIDDADVLRTGGTAPRPGRHSQGAVHPPPSRGQALGHLPAQLQVGPCPPTGPGEPRVAGPGLGGWGRTRRRTIHHRPRFDHLRDLRPGQGGCPPPQPAPYLIRGLYRQAGLSPAAGRGRRNRRRADVPAAREGRANTARGAAHFLRETVGRVRYGGASGQLTVRADSGFYTHSIVSVCRKLDVRFSITHPPAPEPAQSHRGDTRGGLGRRFLTGWTAPPMWRRPPTPPSRVSRTPRRCGSSSGG